jgi:AraC-like DNA-binding protein/mannose-6-phosphate isomerase-like protein (cupin superfamily)
LIHNIDRYKNCFCNKDSEDKIVELLEFSHEKTEIAHVFRHEILFIVRGSVSVKMEGMTTAQKLSRGEFAFMPAGTHMTCSTSRDTTLLVVRVEGEVPECPVFKLDTSADNVSNHKEPDIIYALKANRRIRHYVDEMIETLSDGFMCRHFLLGEANRLLFLLNAYYPESDRVKFFSHILTPDIKFSEFVRMNHSKYRTIGEMADAMCMTSQAFSNRFKKVFGVTPHKWTLQEKARQIYLDICRSDMPLKEIANKYDFPLSSNFFRFCKQTFGQSPGNIRKSLNKNKPFRRAAESQSSL